MLAVHWFFGVAWNVLALAAVACLLVAGVWRTFRPGHRERLRRRGPTTRQAIPVCTVAVLILLVLAVCGSGVSAAILQPSLAQVDSANKRIQADLSTISNRVDSLKEARVQQLIQHSASLITVADTVIYWSSTLFALVAFAGAVFGFVGFREYRAIRRAHHEAAQLRLAYDALVARIKTMQDSTETTLRELASTFERESRTFMEAAYNFGLATEAYNKSDFKTAIRFFAVALSLQPSNVRILCRLGRSFTNVGDTDSAITHFTRALAIDGTNPIALRGLSGCYRYTDQAKAIEYAVAATKAELRDYEAFNYLGLLYRDAGQLTLAVAAHRDALSIRVAPETYFFLGLLSANSGEHVRAKRELELARLNLDEAAPDLALRHVWRSLIRWSSLLLSGAPEDARRAAANLLPFLTTQRTSDAVWSHVSFLLQAVQPGELDAYRAILTPQKASPPC